MALAVNVLKDNVIAVVEFPYMHAEGLTQSFPEGDVYVRFSYSWGKQWRVLQRASRPDAGNGYLAVILPIEVHQLPECVQVVHLCTE